MKIKLNKSKILQDLKADLSAAKDLQSKIYSKILERRSTYNGDPYGNEEPNKSKIVPKVAKRQSQWAHATLKDPFVSTPDIIKCNPVTYEDVKAARQNEILLNYQFCRQFDRYNFMTKAIKVLDVDGTLFVQTGWEYEGEEVEIETDVIEVDEQGNEHVTKGVTTKTIVHKNRPTARVCRSEDIFVDPTCQDDFDNAQFIVYRYETDLSTLKKDGRYKNLDKVQASMLDDDDYDYVNPDKTEFKFRDKARKKLLVYEYWGNYDIDGSGIARPIVCAWIGNVIIRLEDNPYPDKKPPFLVVPFSSVPFQLHGENNMDLIEDQQKIITAITRGLINNMAQSTNGQIGIKKMALDPIQRKRFFAGKNFEFNGSPNDFWQGNFNPIPGSAFEMLQLANNEVESLTGIKGFSGGLTGQSLGNTATSVRGVLDAASVRRLDLVRNIAENLIKPLMRKWMAYNSEFLSEEEVVRVTNDQFIPIRRDDLEGKIDIEISISTAEDNSAKSQQLSFLLQTLGNSLPFDLTKIILADMAKLARMPELERKIKQYQPEPDPAKQLEMQKLRAEIEALKATVADKYARAEENEVDKQLKLSKAQVEAAKARKLNSDADLLDLKHIKEDSGFDHIEKLELQEQKFQHELQKEIARLRAQLQVIEAQAQNHDENIGLMRE